MATITTKGRTARTYSSYHANEHSEIIKEEEKNLRHLDEVVFEPLRNEIVKRMRQIQSDEKKLLKCVESRKKSFFHLIAKYFKSLEEKVIANCSRNSDVLAEKRQKIAEEQSKIKLFCRNQRKMSVSAPSSFDMRNFLREVEKFKRRGRNIAHDQAVITIESIELVEDSVKGEELLQKVGSAFASVKIEELFDVGMVEKRYRVRINTPPVSQMSKRNSDKQGKSTSRFPVLPSETATTQHDQGQLKIFPIQSKQTPGYSSSHEHSLKYECNKKLKSQSSLAGDERELPEFAQSSRVIPSTQTPQPQERGLFPPMSNSVRSVRSCEDLVNASTAKLESDRQPASCIPSPPTSLRTSSLPKAGNRRTRTSSTIMSVRSVSPDECDRPDDGPRMGESAQSIGHPLPLLSSESALEKAVHCTRSTRPYAQVSPFVGGNVKSLIHLYGVDTLADGTRVVVETDTLHFLDKESDEVFKSIDLYTKDEAKATGCFDLTVLPNDDVIISDSQRRALLIVPNYSEECELYMPLKGMVPKGIANDGKVIFVSDAEGRCVHKIDIATRSIIGRIDLEPTADFPEATRSGGIRRACPKYLAINGRGDLVLSDAYNNTLYLINQRDHHVRVSMFGSETIPQLAHPTMPAGVSWLNDDRYVIAVQGTEQSQLIVIGIGASPDGREPSCDVVNVFGSYSVSAGGEDKQGLGSPEGVTTFGDRVLVSDFSRLHSFPLGYVTDGASV